jgi:hypothetical protein
MGDAVTIDYEIRENATGKVRGGWWTPMGGTSPRVIEFMATHPDWAYPFKHALFTGRWGGPLDAYKRFQGEYTFLWAMIRETGQVICRNEDGKGYEVWFTPDLEAG